MIIIPGSRKSLAKRYYANVIDYTIIFIIMIVFILTLGEENENGGASLTGTKALIIPVAWFIYFPLMEGLTGQTIGKKIFNLHMVSLNGDNPTIIEALLRRVTDPIELISFGIPALLMINGSTKNQRLGDMIGGTTVVNVEAVCRFCHTELDLLPKEVINGVFTCPNCGQLN